MKVNQRVVEVARTKLQTGNNGTKTQLQLANHHGLIGHGTKTVIMNLIQ